MVHRDLKEQRFPCVFSPRSLKAKKASYYFKYNSSHAFTARGEWSRDRRSAHDSGLLLQTAAVRVHGHTRPNPSDGTEVNAM